MIHVRSNLSWIREVIDIRYNTTRKIKKHTEKKSAHQYQKMFRMFPAAFNKQKMLRKLWEQLNYCISNHCFLFTSSKYPAIEGWFYYFLLQFWRLVLRCCINLPTVLSFLKQGQTLRMYNLIVHSIGTQNWPPLDSISIPSITKHPIKVSATSALICTVPICWS